MDLLSISAVNWARGQFALTAGYHWIFVPLTIGLALIMAIMESIYVKTGDEKWKITTRFWQKIFGINFAIGIATGIILEFQFGTNWSNYSWFVGDIFGAPLAIEGIIAFFSGSHLCHHHVFWLEQGKQESASALYMACLYGSHTVCFLDPGCQRMDAIPHRNGIQSRYRAQ